MNNGRRSCLTEKKKLQKHIIGFFNINYSWEKNLIVKDDTFYLFPFSRNPTMVLFYCEKNLIFHRKASYVIEYKVRPIL